MSVDVVTEFKLFKHVLVLVLVYICIICVCVSTQYSTSTFWRTVWLLDSIFPRSTFTRRHRQAVVCAVGGFVGG